MVQNAKNNKILKDIEDDILRLLATSEGDVLEDDTLVDKALICLIGVVWRVTLAVQVTDSKAVSDDINEKKKVAEAHDSALSRISNICSCL